MERPEILEAIQTPFSGSYKDFILEGDDFYNELHDELRPHYLVGRLEGTIGVLHSYILSEDEDRLMEKQYIAHLEKENEQLKFQLQSKNNE